ncbi:tetratricopeptide repeat protein [Caenispirillum bisanense]|uniref:Tetratricopeptide repeat-containing protein n=1 Tax=Caenispirillum bisanense TaxID=414052 RepID=A0A286GLM9_9PROT|nr:tetratricopeptide repeat protein [Caenispirillum bisanense]SOD96096.1 Tetratricopeptide repeat-containing protein [Caenispirillum bisanense]
MTLDCLSARLLRGAALAALLALVPTACATAGKAGDGSVTAQAGTIHDLRAWGLGKIREGEPLVSGPQGYGSYLAARQAQMGGDTRVAADRFVEALEADPENPLILRRAYFYLVAEGRIEDAVPLARKALALDASEPLAPLVLAASAVADGRFAPAEEIVARLDDRGLNAFMVPLMRAWALAGQKRWEPALKVLEPLKDQPQFQDLYAFHAALLADIAGRTEEADRHYATVLADAPDITLRALQAGASWLYRQGRTQEAEALLDEFAAAHNDNGLIQAALEEIRSQGGKQAPVADARDGMAEVFYGAATTLLQGNAFDTALAFARLAQHLDRDLALARMLTGDILTRMGREADANEVYATAEPGSIAWYTARLRMADNLERLDRLDEAVALLREVAAAFPDRAEPLVVVGDLHRRNKQWTEAVAAYDAALDRVPVIGPEHWSWYYSRGIAHERADQWSQAEADFKKALDLSPDQPFVLNYLGYSWIDKGMNLAEGREMIEKAVQQRPRDGYIVDSLGWVLFLMGDYPEAVRHLERAVELTPEDPTINDHLGDAYWMVGRRNEARFQWQRALDMKPEEPGQADRLREKIRDGLGEPEHTPAQPAAAGN